MKEIILIKNGELALKGLNRSTFEDIMIKNIRRNMESLGKFTVRKAQSTIYIEPAEDGFDNTEAEKRIGKIFGIAGYAKACVAEKNMDDILEKTKTYLGEALAGAATFKVNAKRADKKFPYNSPEICTETGGYILEHFPHLTVDVHNPEISIDIEIRDFGAYIRSGQHRGAGGMPVGTGGRAAVLISGGIDSPVASWMMAKRGIELSAIHFASPPYTSQRAEMKVRELLKIVAGYSGRIHFALVPFTEIQQEINKHCKEDLSTILMRRFMMRISERIARKNKASALITGESVGQVASQTMAAIEVIQNTVTMPVLRPVIGMDKEEIIAIARKIGTFETSIEPFEDCCTVFTPKHPKTKPNIPEVVAEEEKLNIEELINTSIDATEYSWITP